MKKLNKENIKKKFNKIKSFSLKKDGIKSLKFFVKQFKKYISTNVLFCSYVVISIIMSTTLRALTLGNLFALRPFITDLAIIVVFGSFGYFIKPKKQFNYYFVLIIFTTLLCLINSIYYQFYLSYVSVTLINAVSQIQGVSGAIFEKLSILNFIYILGPITFVLINKKLKKGSYFDYVSETEKGKKLFMNTFIIGGIIGIIIIATMSALEWSRLVKQWNREFIVQRLGLYAYTINDVVQGIQPKISSLFNYDESARIFRDFYDNKESQTSNSYTGLFEGKNVLFVHMESIQTFLIDLKINGQEITPNLNKLVKKSKYFSNFYPQISIGTSSDTEFTLLTSLMPSNYGTAFVSYSDRTFVSLPSLFKEKGYYTFSTHGNNADYWNRRVMHKTLGYDDFFAKDSYEITETTYMGISDEAFYEQLVEKLKVIDSEHENYFGTIITLTNHTPWYDEEVFDDLKLTKTYTYIDEDGNKVTGEANWLENTEIGRYLVSSHYADKALGKFIEDLENEGLLDDTILILYGDHQAKLPVKQFNLLYNYDPVNDDIRDEDDPKYVKYDKYDNYINNKTPFIIYTGNTGIEFSGEEKSVMGMYDVLPTITNLFGTNYSKYALGNDFYSDNEKIVIFPNGNFITDNVYYNSTEDKFIALTNKAIDTEYIERLKRYTDERLSVSNALLVHNLIKADLEQIKSNEVEESSLYEEK